MIMSKITAHEKYVYWTKKWLLKISEDVDI